MGFATKHLPVEPDAVAPDGSNVRLLLSLHRGSVAHFELAPGATSKAVSHRKIGSPVVPPRTRESRRCFRHQLLLRRPEARPRPGWSATGSARDRWRELPRLHRTDPGADPAARRHRHCRQSRGPQGRRHPTRHPGRRGHPLVLATLQPGPQSHRALLREAQGPRSHRSLSQHRDALAVPRRVLGALQP